MRKVFVLIAGLMMALPAAAAPLAGPPELKVDLPPTFTHAAKNPAAGDIRLGNRQILLEKMKIQDLANQLKNPVGNRSDASTALHWVCVTAGSQRFWFTSDDMGGGRINGVMVTPAVAGEKADPTCRAAGGANATLKLPNGVALGMAEASLRQTMGAPSYDRSGLVGWYYEKKVAESRSWSELWVRVEGGKVTAVSLSQVSGM